jgi:hypothetical protein
VLPAAAKVLSLLCQVIFAAHKLRKRSKVARSVSMLTNQI